VKWKDTPSIDKIEGKFNAADEMTGIWDWRPLDCGEKRVSMTVKPKTVSLGIGQERSGNSHRASLLSRYTSLSSRGSRPFFPGFFLDGGRFVGFSPLPSRYDPTIPEEGRDWRIGR
jgi:hypothetical protein